MDQEGTLKFYWCLAAVATSTLKYELTIPVNFLKGSLTFLSSKRVCYIWNSTGNKSK